MTHNSPKDPSPTDVTPPDGTETDAVITDDDGVLSFDATGAEPVDDADAQPVTPDPAARVAELESELETVRGDYLRALAEAQNTKRLADKRIQDNTRYAVSNLAKVLLPVADNMERALAAAPEEARVADPHLKNLAVGVEMTAKEFIGALGQYGVTKVEALDRPFDPNLHQAVQEVENKDVPAGTVVQVYQAGYVIHDRLLRPAMVVVSRGGPKRAEPPLDAGESGDSADQESPKAVDTSA